MTALSREQQRVLDELSAVADNLRADLRQWLAGVTVELSDGKVAFVPPARGGDPS